MILTNCAACAAPLPHPAKQCSRCKTLYCGPACQKQHWDGGHKDLCKKIKKTGGAEPYNANKKYSEAVTVAVEKCADDTKGQTCFICTQALHWKTKEGLVRGCACRGTAGLAHVSCLAEQAKILYAESEENNLTFKVQNERWKRWYSCSLCEQDYHGVVRCALGWACWKTYVGRPEADWARGAAMTELGLGLSAVYQHEDALSVGEAELSTLRRLGGTPDNILSVMSNLACTYELIGRSNEALSLRKDVYSGRLKLDGEEDILNAANNYATSLAALKRFEEAKSLMRKTVPKARGVLGEAHEITLGMMQNYAMALYMDDGATLDDLREAVTTLEETGQMRRRVFGGAHPLTQNLERGLRKARAVLRAREGDDVSSVCDAVEKMTPGDA
ncbi:unnamed protein product [Pelagomonas calceolata]|uniref:MYND-type domain-containing protein n=1 Tax=Pelagomonas calceolata TaxID=35677 RepID=A0A8J2SNA1_9STRA|nr:unnamed protein product [Pelagomonas calceolata]